MKKVASLFALLLFAAACGGSDSDGASGESSSEGESPELSVESSEAVVEEEPDSSNAMTEEGTEKPTPTAEESLFPIEIVHAYGTTVIESRPERVAAVAWGNHEVPLALGIVPVGMAKVTWGDDDDNGVLPWVEEALAELGAETPVLFDETDGIDFEGVAATEPDIILAAYSGISQEDYDLLSKIAPVVAFPEVAWGTSVQDMITISSTALGLAAEGEQLIADLSAEVLGALGNYPQLQGKKIIFTYIDPTDLSQIGFYTNHDTRPGFLLNIGLGEPAIVTQESANTTDFYVQVSAELADQFGDVDIFVTYGEADGAIIEQIQADLLLSKIPAIQSGSIAILENSTPLAASANPSPLSIAWGIDDYFALLSAALPAG